MYKIGLTGSIGSGKSTVSTFIKNRGIPVLDADEIARGLTEKGSPVLDELVQAFGKGILDEENNLNRKKLSEIAFASDEGKRKLSEIVTQKAKDIIEAWGEELELSGETIAFFDVPLLFENNMEGAYDEVWSVVAPLEVRLDRVLNREEITKEDFFARDRAQVPQEEKIRRSNVVINNNLDIESLYGRINEELNRVYVLIEG